MQVSEEGLPPKFIFGPLAILTVARYLGIAFSPYLLVEAPLALVLLSPLVRHLVLVSPSLDPVPFFALATFGLFAQDPFMYALGHRYGQRAIVWIEVRSVIAGRAVRQLEWLFARAGPLVVLVWPGPAVCTLAGVFHMPLRRFVGLDLAGTLVLVVLVRHAGEAFRAEIEMIQAWVGEHLPTLTSITALAAFVGWLAWRRQARIRLEAAEPREGP